MDLKFIEAGHRPRENGIGGNWGKFAVGRWSNDELVEPTMFPGCEGQRITSLNGRGIDHIWVFDLQTGESARFHTNNPIPVDVPDQLRKHGIWVCPMFEPFMVALWQFIRERPNMWWDELPRTMFVPDDTPFETAGYRRPGPYADILDRFDQIEELLGQLLESRPDRDGINIGAGFRRVRDTLRQARVNGVDLTDDDIEQLAAEAEAGYPVDKLKPRPDLGPDAGRPRTDDDVQQARRVMTYRSLDEEQV
jgi:hypothetical protein